MIKCVCFLSGSALLFLLSFTFFQKLLKCIVCVFVWCDQAVKRTQFVVLCWNKGGQLFMNEEAFVLDFHKKKAHDIAICTT